MTSAITGAVSWAAARHSSSVELAKVKAENQRLMESNREEERRNRQTTYHQFMDEVNRLHQTLGKESPKDRRDEICRQYNHLLSGMMVFSPPAVREGAYRLNEVYLRIWPALAEEAEKHPDKPEDLRWREATATLVDDFTDRGVDLVELMHKDVTRGITSD